jgi:hypothetical protein
MKRFCSHILPVVASMIFSSTANAVPSQVTVSNNGIGYTIGTQYTNYTANPSFFTSQPWWGNASLAFQLSGLVQDQLGFTLFGYATSGGNVSIAYWSGGNNDCPSGCPSLGSDYDYASLISMSGLVTLQSLSNSLISTASGVDFAISNANMLINGAHSRPLSRRVAAGEKTAWVAGDLGRDDHGSRDGSTGVAEIGGGYNFGPAQINLTIGKTWGNQHLANNGTMDADGQYLMAEGIIPVSESHGLFATVGAYGHRGNVDISRGYLNSGVQNFSTASPDTHTWGVRARLDWEKAFAVKSVDFSPYADLSYTRSRMDGYTETDGGLPARFDSRTDHSTEIRGGVNAEMPIAATQLNWVANLEVAHRFNNNGASTTGEVIGLFSFNLPGENYQSTWLKGGMGVEGELGRGKASLMLNATTRSSMPNAWLAASYQLNF